MHHNVIIGLHDEIISSSAVKGLNILNKKAVVFISVYSVFGFRSRNLKCVCKSYKSHIFIDCGVDSGNLETTMIHVYLF